MRAAIYNPYLDTLGGGERYTLAVAQMLRAKGYKVNIEWGSGEILKKLEDRFGQSLKEINIVPSIKKGDGYDLCFWVSDGSIPTLRARRNWLHFQVPFHGVGGGSLLNKMKLFRIENVICNSNFTKNVIDQEFKVRSIVLCPPVDTDKFKPKRKKNNILFVGRFSELMQSKNQNILIDAFKKLYDQGLTDWQLQLAGGIEVGAQIYLGKLKELAKGYPIEFITSPDFSELTKLYGEATIFWSAVGFGEDEKKHPEKVEHFGISAVEAMSAGCIPILYSAGGYKEIVRDGENGYLWNDLEQLVLIVKNLAKKSIQNIPTLRYKLKITANNFSYKQFAINFSNILG